MTKEQIEDLMVDCRRIAPDIMNHELSEYLVAYIVLKAQEAFLVAYMTQARKKHDTNPNNT